MLCWGYWSLGQPGIGTNLQGIVAEPQVCGFISDRSVKEVACGGNHSVFLLEDGEVYTCGLNTKGQLGHEREGNKPGECTLFLFCIFLSHEFSLLPSHPHILISLPLSSQENSRD
uniref:Uncharacterized protein n=1 Tax=Spermophilus dauricus TaxID=99837 RepID=A0A8C9QNU3_SPEDA